MLTTASFPNRVSLGLALLPALGCAGLALELALHYPLSVPLALIGVLAAIIAAARWWTLTPLLLLAPLPLIGGAPWTGWITFEELDMLVLACAAGGYLAWGLQLPPGGGPAAPLDRVPAWRRALGYSASTLLLMVLFAASLVLSMERGFADAGGFVWGWFEGYHESMNSVRLAKSFFEVLLLMPLWVRAGFTRPRELTQALLFGMVGALACICAVTLWERSVNTGLLNFSSDYRTTALFWEMHVGGAALDGSLALTVPFAVMALLRVRSPRRFLALLLLVMLAIYVSLTTFSRGVYLALPIGLALMVQLRGAQRRRTARAPVGPGGKGVAALMSVPPLGKLGGLLLLGGFTASALLMFESSGYRGQLALLGTMLMLLAMPGSQWLLAPAQRVMVLVSGALMAAVIATLCWALSAAVPKIAYVEYVLAWVLAVLLRWRDRPGEARPLYACLVSASWFWLVAQVVIVANNWGGPRASDIALSCMTGLALLWPLMLLAPALWPFKSQGIAGWRARGLLFGGLLAVGAVTAVLGGGVYMKGRVADSTEDMQVRIDHWKEGVWMLTSSEDWLFGKGTGRYVANRFFSGPKADHIGDYRIRHDGTEPPFLVLTGGQQMLGWGEMFRVTQRITRPEGQVLLNVRARAAQDAALHVEICEKHLLYADHCLLKDVTIKASEPGGAGRPWQDAKLALGDGTGFGGPWYWPRLIAFSVAVGTPGGVIEIADLDLRDARGTPLLANGDFSQEMSRWFFSSDRNHLPWHMKNLGLHVLFDQGEVGLALFGAMLLLALWRTSLGQGRDHPLAPALAGSIVGFLGVGAFDSLIDAPRIAFMFYVVLAFALGLRALPGAVAEPAR